MTSVGGTAGESPRRGPMVQTPRATISNRLRLNRQQPGTQRMLIDSQITASQEKQTLWIRRPIANSLKLTANAVREQANQSETKTSLDLGSTFCGNMNRISEHLELQSKHAPKLISGLNKEHQSSSPFDEINFFSANLDRQRSKVGQYECNGLPPAYKRKFLGFLSPRAPKMPDLGLQGTPCELPTGTLEKSPIPDAANSIPMATKESVEDDDPILETFSRNAQYKTSKRRMTRMTNNPLVVTVENKNSEEMSQLIRSLDNSDTPHKVRNAHRPATPMIVTARANRNSNADLAVQFKDLLDQEAVEQIILDIKQARQSRPSIDLGVLAQDQMWMKLGSSQEMRVHSTKSALLKSKLQIRSSRGIGELATDRPPILRTSVDVAKKKVVFAKNKMVLLFEKDF